MDRRKSLKLIVTGAVAAPIAIAGCNTGDDKKETALAEEPKFDLDRNPDEIAYEKALLAKGRFFTDHELATMTILCDMIIPQDEISGSASEAKVPEFIDFIVQEMTQHQVPLRGGLRWLDMFCIKKYEKAFKDCTPGQRTEIADLIAYPERGKDKPELAPGIRFFSLARDLTATGFYTSAIGVKDLGYMGNKPTQWNGVPQEVLDQYKVAYTEKELAECVSFSNK
jgi:hypothetical protein